MSSTEQKRFRDALAASTRAFKSASAEAMRPLDVHPGQNFLLEALRAEGSLTLSELARHLRIEVPTAVRMAKRMESAGLVARSPDPDDRRRVQISLTKAGRRTAGTVPRRLDAVSDRALRGLDQTERRDLISLLERVSANLDGP